jgi:Tfp pilus assembly protein PilX
MNTLRRMLDRIHRRSDDGFAMIMVMGIGLVILILVTAAVSVSVSDMLKSRGDQNWAAAESAAYAGVSDYESKLSNSNTYYLYGNPASSFSPANTVTMPATSNLAFGLGTGSGDTHAWATVPGGDGSATYRYEVDNSKYASTGIVRLRSTGRVGNELRTIVVNVKQHGFVDFMYFTNYELQDPAQTNTSCVPTYDWQSNHDSRCSEIQFAPSDVINGPVHSNDTIRICGSTFTQSVTSSDPVAPYYTPVTGCSAATFQAGAPTTSATISMPPTNSQMRQEVRTDLTTVPDPGCLYTGPTSVIFNSDGTMTVRSPFTKATEIAANASTGLLTDFSTPAKCGLIGNVANGLGSTGGATISVLNSNLMFVQDVPSTVGDPNNPNAWAPTAYPTGFTCNNTSSLSGWKFGTLAYPMTNESTPAASPVHYGCRKGDVYANGVMHGTMTITADNYIYVTGDITYQNPITDMLGLVGTNAVWVWNPFTSTGSPLLPNDRTIDAAILSLRHTFQVENYTLGSSPRGTLTVYGALAQQFRGTVGQSTNGTSITQGYSKAYNYDNRLQFQAPPKFLSPVSATYGISQLVEVKTPFAPDGSYLP